MMDDKRLQEIKARAEAATPGPWKPGGDCNAIVDVNGRFVIAASWYDGPFLYITEEDAEFATAARTDVPALLGEVDRLREENEQWAMVNDSTGFEYKKLTAENARLRRELEAVKYDLGCAGLCENCKHVYNDECSLVCGDSDSPYRWEWRGLCAENGGVE
jgi:hypothetical protein